MFKIITIPFDEGKECFLEDEVNKFCLNKIIKSFEAEFFQSRKGIFWTIFLECEPVLYESARSVGLYSVDRLLFERLRE